MLTDSSIAFSVIVETPSPVHACMRAQRLTYLTYLHAINAGQVPIHTTPSRDGTGQPVKTPITGSLGNDGRLTCDGQPVISTGWHRLTDPNEHRLTDPDSTGWPTPIAQVGRPQNPPKQEHRSTCTKFNQGTSTCNFCVSVRADL